MRTMLRQKRSNLARIGLMWICFSLCQVWNSSVVRSEQQQTTESVLGDQLVSEVCDIKRKRHIVRVDAVAMACADSNNGYEFTSLTCNAGDQVKLKLDLTIEKVPADLSVDMSLTMKLYGQTSAVTNRYGLCQFHSFVYSGTVDDDSYSSPCPITKTGSYILETVFVVPQQLSANDSYMGFKPDLSIEFYDGTVNQMIGCAQTGTLAQMALNRRNEERGEWVLGFSVVLFAAIFGACLRINHKKQKQEEAQRQNAIKRRRRRQRLHYANSHPPTLGVDLNPAHTIAEEEDDSFDSYGVTYHPSTISSSSSTGRFTASATSSSLVGGDSSTPRWRDNE